MLRVRILEEQERERVEKSERKEGTHKACRERRRQGRGKLYSVIILFDTLCEFRYCI